jgi:trehalose-6-phosphate synthase
MNDDDRRRRMQKMRAIVSENNIYRWAGKLLSALTQFEFSVSGLADSGLALVTH